VTGTKTSRLSPEERKRRRELVAHVALVRYGCDTCGMHAGHPCQSTGRSRAPGKPLAKVHKPRRMRARSWLSLYDYDELVGRAAKPPVFQPDTNEQKGNDQ